MWGRGGERGEVDIEDIGRLEVGGGVAGAEEEGGIAFRKREEAR